MKKYLKEATWFLIPIICSIICYQMLFGFNNPYVSFPSLHIFIEVWICFTLLTLVSFLVFYTFRIISERFTNLISNSIFLIVNLLSIICLMYLARFLYFYNESYILMPEEAHEQIKKTNTDSEFLMISGLTLILIFSEIFIIVRTLKTNKHSA